MATQGGSAPSPSPPPPPPPPSSSHAAAAAAAAAAAHAPSSHAHAHAHAPRSTTIQALPLRPPPVYALVAPGVHRCSAIGLEEVLHEAWGGMLEREGERERDKERDRDKDKERDREKDKERDREKDKERDREKDKERDREKDRDREREREREREKERDREKATSSGVTAAGSKTSNAEGSASTSAASSATQSTPESTATTIITAPTATTHPTPPRSPLSVTRPPSAPASAPTPTPTAGQGQGLTQAAIEASSVLSFLVSLRLRTIVYLSPSLLPSALLKLGRQLDLNLLQWDLSGGKVWRVRDGRGGNGGDEAQAQAQAKEKEERALRAFAERGRKQRGSGSDEDLNGLDRVSMCRATVEVMLSRHCGGVLVCDPSGLSETSLVVGCLRRMTRASFASVCLEYRAFAPNRSASTANNLRFIEMFPLETLELPDWPDLIPTAAQALLEIYEQLSDDHDDDKDNDNADDAENSDDDDEGDGGNPLYTPRERRGSSTGDASDSPLVPRIDQGMFDISSSSDGSTTTNSNVEKLEANTAAVDNGLVSSPQALEALAMVLCAAAAAYLAQSSLYASVHVPPMQHGHGSILRLSDVLSTAATALLPLLPRILACAALALTAACLLSSLISTRISAGTWFPRRLSAQEWQRQVVLVTGGSGGVGSELVKLLAMAGATVISMDVCVCARNGDDDDDAADAPWRRNVLHLSCDVSDAEAVRASLQSSALHAHTRGRSVTMLVNNAGVRTLPDLRELERTPEGAAYMDASASASASSAAVPATPGLHLSELSAADVQRTIGVNLISQFTLLREVLPQMLSGDVSNDGEDDDDDDDDDDDAHILCVSSVMGHVGVPQMGDYVASKFGVVGLYESLVRELRRRRVHASLLLPAHIATPLFPHWTYPWPFSVLTPTQSAASVARTAMRILGSRTSQRVFAPRTAGVTSGMALLPQWAREVAQYVSGADAAVDEMNGRAWAEWRRGRQWRGGQGQGEMDKAGREEQEQAAAYKL